MTVLCGFVLVHTEDVGLLVPAKKEKLIAGANGKQVHSVTTGHLEL